MLSSRNAERGGEKAAAPSDTILSRVRVGGRAFCLAESVGSPSIKAMIASGAVNLSSGIRQAAVGARRARPTSPPSPSDGAERLERCQHPARSPEPVFRPGTLVHLSLPLVFFVGLAFWQDRRHGNTRRPSPRLGEPGPGTYLRCQADTMTITKEAPVVVQSLQNLCTILADAADAAAEV